MAKEPLNLRTKFLYVAKRRYVGAFGTVLPDHPVVVVIAETEDQVHIALRNVPLAKGQNDWWVSRKDPVHATILVSDQEGVR